MIETLPLVLTEEEVRLLTGRKRHSAQRRALQYMEIDHKQRPDGSIVVVKSVLDAAPNFGRNRKRTEPNWDALNYCRDEGKRD